MSVEEVKPTYYDGTKLLSMKDIDGNKPEIYLCTTNRTGGKTTWFSRWMTKRWFDYGEKFMLVYRYKAELDDCADKFYKDISSLFFPGTVMTAKSKAGGHYCELYIDNKHCGYAAAINSASKLKNYSHVFSDVQRMFMDEFQSESNEYCSKEITKFQSLHTSVARGQGKQCRYVPVYMCANTVSLLNPYYIAMGISQRLKSETKFLRGKGYVLEQGFVESASKAQLESGFNKAFSEAGDSYIGYSSGTVYLNDSKAFIEKPQGNSKYIATLRYKGCDFAVREYTEEGLIYCDDRPDNSFPLKIAVTTKDHKINYVMLRSNELFLYDMRYFFDRGCFRFKNLICKEVILAALSY